MKFIDLFAGIGGFRYGLECVSKSRTRDKERIRPIGNKPDNQSKHEQRNTVSFDCVYSNEWDKYAASVYRKHYGECDTRDIRTVDAGEIPKFNLLCGGFPCQSFSVAGKGKGFDDARGTLFFEIARILSERQPEHLLLENVKGLLTNDSGRTFQRILRILADLGYRVEWQVLNSKHFGVPQNRERVFIIGHLRGECGRKIFPITGTNPKNLKEITKGESQGMRVYEPDGISTTLASEAGGLGAKTGLYAMPVLTPDREEKRQNGRRMKESGEPSFTLTGQDRHGVYDGVRIRRLTPTECERLQGFEDSWTAKGIDEDGNEVEISDTQRYKVLGNAVSTPVIEAIGSNLMGEK